MKKTLIYLMGMLLMLFSFKSNSQDTIIAYDVLSQNIVEIPSVPYDTTIIFQHTSSSIGSMGNQVPLSLTTPTTNLFEGSNFSDIERAELFYDVTDYPIRTAIKLFGWKGDTLSQGCSGIMVGENFVLTAKHCVKSQETSEWIYDSMLVVPAYDNGSFQNTLPTSKVEKYYVFKEYNDLALLQLREPIGQEIGWIGMAFSSDTSYFSDKVFHKLSYPAKPHPTDPSLIYNGDTLYYNYGEIDIISSFLGVFVSDAVGVPGQSGSSLFYTDNTDYYSFGIFTYGFHYRHTQITNAIFYLFKSIVDSSYKCENYKTKL